MTQEKFAEKTGLSRLAIVNIESGSVLKLNSMTIYKLNKYFKSLGEKDECTTTDSI
ncbi:helix-turn-helix transcriptional regulator [bacterium]|nr:helix-turn-helix transcriptional regulator [bacterium]